MYTFTMDARDGSNKTANGCSTCCCEAISMKPGETILVTLNYVPWSVPFGRPGLTPGFDYHVEKNDSGCSTTAVNGQLPPGNISYRYAIIAGDMVTLDFSGTATPAGGTFIYEILPLYGPRNGKVQQSGTVNDGKFFYTPNNGFNGYDYLHYRMKDTTGREVIRAVEIAVGCPDTAPQTELLSDRPYVDPSKIRTDCVNHLVQFPIHLPLVAADCDKYRLTIRQRASDCNGGQYSHESCFDINAKDC